MKKRYLFGIPVASMTVFAVIAMAPVYQFYAHRGALPLPPTGWLHLPETMPTVMTHDDDLDLGVAQEATTLLAAHRAHIAAPALTGAVAVDGRVVWQGAVGWADIEGRRPVTLDTAFRIGSTSKAVTATLFARLHEQRAVDLDMRLDQIFEQLPNTAWADIRLSQLAAHSAGIPHYKDNTEWLGLYHSIALRRQFDTVIAALSLFDESAVLFSPGEQFHYSTLGTVLLAAALAEATATPYQALINREIVDALGVKSLQPAPVRSDWRENLAMSYFSRGDGYRRWRDVNLSHRLPGGGFVATSRDLAVLGSAWLNEDYLSEATRLTFWTPQRLNDGSVNAQNYALGFRWTNSEIEGVGMVAHANHGGVSRGAQSWLMIIPALGMSIAINTNRKTASFSDFAILYKDLVRLFASETVASNCSE